MDYSRGHLYVDISLVIMAIFIIGVYLLYIHVGSVRERVSTLYLYITAVFVAIGILRYLYLIFINKDSGSPVRIFFKDRIIQYVLASWIVTFGFGLYW